MNPILIVDDEKDNLEALQRLLRNQYAVTVTTSPFEALKLVQKNEFSVIVSDQRMPEMTGVELLEKSKHIAPTTTRILLTGYTDIDSVIGAINRGNIYRYIAKPWDPEDLRLTLRQADEAYNLRREIEKKNEALTKSNSDLKKALESLRTLDKAKARFLSLISHELNTPLTILTSYAALLSDRKSSFPDDIKKGIGAVSEAAARFSQIVSEVLTYVRLESEGEFTLQSCNLNALCKTVVGEIEPEAAKRKIRVSSQLAQGLTSLCDPEKLKVALRKLLGDALLHAPANGEVRLIASKNSGMIHFSVWRAGEVLSSEAFSPLVSPGPEMNHQKNLGLSLAIFKLIVEGHGAEVTLESTSAKGTTIRFSLPEATP
jgi:two-component system sensor histidine kinase/response regulator